MPPETEMHHAEAEVAIRAANCLNFNAFLRETLTAALDFLGEAIGFFFQKLLRRVRDSSQFITDLLSNLTGLVWG
jgi:hypothetical protein